MTGPACDHHTGCITCGDEGIPMRVVSQAELGIAICVADDDTKQEVAIDLVEPVNQGDELLVHAGVAIANLGDAA